MEAFETNPSELQSVRRLSKRYILNRETSLGIAKVIFDQSV